MTSLFEIWRSWGRTRKFISILVSVALISVIASGITKLTVLWEDESDYLQIAVVGPMTGTNEAIGQSMLRGAQLYARQLNADEGIDGVKFGVVTYDDENSVDKAREVAREIVANERVIAVIGHWSPAASLATMATYAEGEIPVITPRSTLPTISATTPWVFANQINMERQASFLANYVRNVMGHKLVSIIQDRPNMGASVAEPFEATFRRFGTQPRYNWHFDPESPTWRADMNRIVSDLAEKKDAGTVFLALSGEHAAMFLSRMRNANVRNRIVGTNLMATGLFSERLSAEMEDEEQAVVAQVVNGIVVAAPLLFDTANETAQNFLSSYQVAHGSQPDWVAAYSFDAAQLITEGMREPIRAEEMGDVVEDRLAIGDYLRGLDAPERVLNGVVGGTWFSAGNEAQKPVFIGEYNGFNIISAATQLNPISIGGSRNYIQELREGRVLYVNDRFMYKTNVVYSGLEVNEIREIDETERTFVMDFLMWFRFKGDFRPEDLTFSNAVEPIEFGEPVEEKQVGESTYRLYRLEGKFAANFTTTNRAYGTMIVGISFTHDQLNHNNLLYVKDVLGMRLAQRSVDDMLQEDRALSGSSGWLIERSWISQDVSEKGTKGNPLYVGFSASEPDFSRVDLGILIKPAQIQARDIIPAEFFIYIGIFGFFGALASIAMDQSERGRFWSGPSWLMRLISWPCLLMGIEAVTLDIAFQNLEEHVIDMIVLGFNIVWWMMPARLMGLAMERFVWRPLEDHTERNIPNVIRVFASIVVYSFAAFGVIAFVFDQQLTSVLASTGLLAMIIGLAIQANISNIFSGIVINMERPFNVGDWIQINDMDEGRVVDITWRTTRVKTRNGYVISVPNGQVSEAQVHNFDSFDVIRLELVVQLDAKHSPEDAQMIMMIGVEAADDVLDTPEREVRFKGIKWNWGWVAEYELQFWIDNYTIKEEIAEGVLAGVYHQLRESGMDPKNPEAAPAIPATPEQGALPAPENPDPTGGLPAGSDGTAAA